MTVFSESLVAAARELPWAAWKTASPDIVHRPLLEALAEDGRPLVVSTGAATLDEIVRAAGWLERAEIAFLHCVSAYPTPLAEAALAAMAPITEATGRPCGYSDHTASIATGGLHTCVIDDDAVTCWGYDLFGQRSVPGSLLAPRAIAAGTVVMTEDDADEDFELPSVAADRANCEVAEDEETGQQCLVAIRDIRSGEFLCVAEDET